MIQSYVNKNKFIFIGLFIHLAVLMIYLLLNQNISVIIHDQLDSEVLYYILKSPKIYNSRFAFFMNGQADVTVPSFLTIFYYCLLPAVYAFSVNLFFIRVIAFISIYKVLYEFNVENWICFLVAMTFSMLPIRSVYGLSAMGVGLVILAYIYFYNEKRIYISFLLIGLYGLSSSVVTTGYAVICFIILSIIILLISKKKVVFQILGCSELILIYTLTNIRLFESVLGNNDFISHKSDIKLVASSFISSFNDMLINGQYHVATFHKGIFVILAVYVVYVFLKKSFFANKKSNYFLILNFGIIVGISLFYALFWCSLGVNVRSSLFRNSSLKGFQLDRFYWLNPILWYVLFGVLLSQLYNQMKQSFDAKRVAAVVVLLWFIPTVNVARESDVSKNVKSFILRSSEYRYDTWKHFFEPDLFSQIDKFIPEQKESFGVVSIGLHPSVALYNGYKCLDGYANNYNLSYKKSFFKIIKNEISKNTDLYNYFVDWGSRCYVFSSEIGRSLPPEKNKTISPSIDTKELYELGVRYIFSSALINNKEELGLRYITKASSENSVYDVYLYKLESLNGLDREN